MNTVGIPGYGADLLTDVAPAQAWVTDAAGTWSRLRGVDVESPTLNDADLPKLRAMRGTVAQMLAGQHVDGRGVGGVGASFTLSDTGQVQLVPAGSGWRWLASALWGEVLLSQQAGTWRRLKQCHRHGCDSTFYDRSKNNSGVWHNVKTCGNAENLRASRARRRDRERAAGLPA